MPNDVEFLKARPASRRGWPDHAVPAQAACCSFARASYWQRSTCGTGAGHPVDLQICKRSSVFAHTDHDQGMPE
jgi:hypothetical protein